MTEGVTPLRVVAHHDPAVMTTHWLAGQQETMKR